MGDGITRLKNARASYGSGDGPVSGAIQFINIPVGTAAVSTAYAAKHTLPIGMKFRITHIYAYVSACLSNGEGTTGPLIKIGTGSDDDAFVASTKLYPADVALGACTLLTTSGHGGNTLVGQDLAATDIVVTITNNATSTYTNARVEILGHIIQPPTSYFERGIDHF